MTESVADANDVSDTVDALEEIYPEPVTVKLRSGAVELRPLTIMEFGAMRRAVRVIAASLNDGEQMIAYVEEHAGDLVPFVAAASGKDKAELARAYGADFLDLFIGAMDANRDFFGRCAALRFGATGLKLIQMIAGAGPAQSTSSATAATPSASATP